MIKGGHAGVANATSYRYDPASPRKCTQTGQSAKRLIRASNQQFQLVERTDSIAARNRPITDQHQSVITPLGLENNHRQERGAFFIEQCTTRQWNIGSENARIALHEKYCPPTFNIFFVCDTSTYAGRLTPSLGVEAPPEVGGLISHKPLILSESVLPSACEERRVHGKCET